MKIIDSFTVQSPLNIVWDYLLNIEEMSKCVPGVESVDAVDENTYNGKLKVRVGPISASFNGTVKITEITPTNRIVAEISGDDRGSATSVKATFESLLEEVEEGTKVNYQMDLNLRGRLAQFGSAVVSATAKKMTAEFAKNLRKSIEN